MVHLRLNAREANPNPHVNWITALPQPSQDSTTAARELLKALAAQVRPVMKKHGYSRILKNIERDSDLDFAPGSP